MVCPAATEAATVAMASGEASTLPCPIIDAACSVVSASAGTDPANAGTLGLASPRPSEGGGIGQVGLGCCFVQVDERGVARVYDRVGERDVPQCGIRVVVVVLEAFAVDSHGFRASLLSVPFGPSRRRVLRPS